MSGYKNFAIVGAGTFGSFVVRQFLKDKASGTVNQVVVLTRQGSKTNVEGDAKVVSVDYSNKESIKSALTGVDVVICTISGEALNLQRGIAEAAKEAGVKLFVPSEFGNVSEGETEGLFGTKANVQNQLKAVGISYALFYTGPFADSIWAPFVDLDVTTGKVSVGGDGNKQISFTSRTDIARYLSYVLTQLPADQLKNRSFAIAGDNKSFKEIFKAYEAKTGKKLEVTYIPVSEFDARIAANPNDFPALLHKFFATAGPFSKTDNHLYPNWNPSSVLDNVPAV
ncbi:NAD-P-binding protein [Multifurca ochricompacta]|uniref:NAD-P-binding protein n=1 Tax=Multifurca ochricompacta TaxID=376703 RepID=A0AAD4LY89_9AGAM|nr:NAD-P-binding protein [Multifurca ochricompacta]